MEPGFGRDAGKLLKRISALVGTDPAGEEAQQLVEEWRQHITKNYYTCTPEILYRDWVVLAPMNVFCNIDYQVGIRSNFCKVIEVYCKKTDNFGKYPI